MVTLTHHKKSVRSLAIHPTEYTFASGSAGGNNIKKWKCPEGSFVFNFSGHNAIINTLSVNSEGVFFSGGMYPLLFLSFPLFSPSELDFRGGLPRVYLIISLLRHLHPYTPPSFPYLHHSLTRRHTLFISANPLIPQE